MASLNHIGIAASDLPAMIRLFQILGLNTAHSEPVPDQGVIAHFLPLPVVQAHVEFLEPTDPQGVIAQFIQKRGPGIHHLSFQLKQGELESTSKLLKDTGYRLMYDKPRNGAHEMKINFIHPSSCGGILIELMEPA